MPKDHLLYLRLKELGLAEFTVTPDYPSPQDIMLVRCALHIHAPDMPSQAAHCSV